ncbi:hypothetical protein ABK040_002522 [Willaertia magna]
MQSFNPAFIEDEEEQTIIIKKEQDDIVDEEFFQSKDLSEMEEALLLFDIERLCEIHYVLSKEEIKSLIESHVLQFLIQLTENNDITTDDLLFKYNFTVNCNNSFNENNNDEETVNYNEEVSSLKPYMVDQNLFSSSKKKTSEFIIQTSNTIYTLKKDKQQNSYNSSKKQKLNSASNTGYSCGLAVGGLRKNYLVWKLLCDVYQLQILQKKITQRELFYMNVSFFNDQIQCNNYIDNICNILKLDRTLLNIVTMGKGLIYSNDGKNNSIVNITPNISQLSIIENIPGDLEYLENNVTFCNEFSKDNSCKNVTLLIIEKECIFKRLIEDKIYKFIPNIVLITGCGFPSLTTRYLCHLITKKFNTCNLKVFGLFDFNIYGFQILNNYKYGSIALSKHVTSQTSTIGEKLQWLGLRYNDIKDIPAMYNQKVTNRELQYIEKHLKYHQLKMSSNTTIPSNKDNYNSYQSIITELEKMKTCKYEIEIIANIHGIDKMGIYFAKKIVSYK